ncbi:MAG: ribosome biogenesis/translation initiation ATPase RLI [Candidatus Methanophagaceae archaeon]|nr:MAG: ribosome biogenesis/translation initiation ATPase RLI [Methanophagales archaeon]
MRIAILKRDKCQPKKCEQECVKYCPMVRTGAETIVLSGSAGGDGSGDGKPKISEELCEGCGICVKKCPFDAISIIGLPEELKGEETHRYGENGFVLYGMPIPKPGKVVGLVGENGTGKSTAIKILSGLQVPNLGSVEKVVEDEVVDAEAKGGWNAIIKKYAGSELQNYFNALQKDKIKVAYKPQNIDAIPKFFDGKVRELLESTDESGTGAGAGAGAGAGTGAGAVERLVKNFGLEEAVEREVKDLSGGELQRVAVVACLVRDADFYFFDEITPYLDIYQRVSVAKQIKESLCGDRDGDGNGEKSVVVVEHDLAVLDMLADYVHLLYGSPGEYGVVTMPKSTNRGINEYLSGFLQAENVRIRDKPIEFTAHPPREKQEARSVFIEYEGFEKSYGGVGGEGEGSEGVEGKGFVLAAKAGSVEKGEVLGVVGRNAIGKSTFLKVLAGETEPTAGAGGSGKVLLDIKISYKPQYVRGASEMSVKDFIYSLKLTDADAVEVLAPLGIRKLEEKQMKDLSGGELQSVAVAACLCQPADLYILDEPSAHLDVEQKVRLIKTVRRFAERRGVSMLVVDHDIYLIDLLSDRLMVFDGVPGVWGESKGCFGMQEGMNLFLQDLGVTFRRDLSTLRPRINKIGSAKDREQKAEGKYYYL